MKKRKKFKVGDEVIWNGAPNEISSSRHGKILKIKRGIAFVDGDYGCGRIRQVPVSILSLNVELYKRRKEYQEKNEI